MSQLRSFLGAANVHRRCIPGYAKVVSPLVEYLRDLPEGCVKDSKHPIVQYEEALAAFHEVMDNLCSPPELAISVTGRRLWIDTDASD